MVQRIDEIADLLGRYEEMDHDSRDVAEGFGLSGWQCANPYASSLLERVSRKTKHLERTSYAYLDDDPRLAQGISDLHRAFDGERPQAILAGVGASPLLFTFAAHLRDLNITEVYCLPPLYFTLLYALRLLGIRVRPVSAFQAFERKCTLNLPDKRTYLLLSDPVWYAGLAVPTHVVDEVREWQSRTGSNVFVDGSFQYMAWDRRTIEITASLDLASTYRVISPTKSLAIHGFRFAYCLLPNSQHRSFVQAYRNIFGSANSENLTFAHEAIAAMRDRHITDKLTALASHRHRRLRKQGIIFSRLSPDRGYFVFEKLQGGRRSEDGLMDGPYFEQNRFPGYVRLNLLSPSLRRLSRLRGG